MMRTNPGGETAYSASHIRPQTLVFFILLLIAPMLMKAQHTNHVVFDSLKSQLIIDGYCDRVFLEGFEPFAVDYAVEYQNYTPAIGPSDSLDSLMKDLMITIVLATWCSDSKTQVPRFFRVLDTLGFPASRVSIIGVDGHKQSAGIDVAPLNAERVPTFIIFSGCKELGRIIETPSNTLEADFLEIIKRKKP